MVTRPIVPRRSANEMSLLSLPSSTSAGRPELRGWCGLLRRRHGDTALQQVGRWPGGLAARCWAADVEACS